MKPEKLSAETRAVIAVVREALDVPPAAPYPGDRARPAPAVWDDSVPPGGYVCGAPDEGPDGICGMPVESELCPYHGQPATGTPGDAAGPSGGVS